MIEHFLEGHLTDALRMNDLLSLVNPEGHRHVSSPGTDCVTSTVRTRLVRSLKDSVAVFSKSSYQLLMPDAGTNISQKCLLYKQKTGHIIIAPLSARSCRAQAVSAPGPPGPRAELALGPPGRHQAPPFRCFLLRPFFFCPLSRRYFISLLFISFMPE